MDIIRAVAKAVYVDMPEWEVCKIWLFGLSEAEFEEALKEVLSHSAKEFTRSEVDRIIQLAKRKWITGNSGQGKFRSFNPAPLFGILNNFGEECLDLSGSIPRVRFDYLLRWRDLTWQISEDIVVAASLAEYDLKYFARREMRNFAWPDVLDHDNVTINRVLEKGLADTHAHLNASSDIFMINWISMMNSRKSIKEMGGRVHRDFLIGDNRFPMMGQRFNPVGGKVWSVYRMGLAAAACRAFMVSSIHDHNLCDRLSTLLRDILDTDLHTFSVLSSDLYNLINLLRKDAMKSVFGSVVDYALIDDKNNQKSSVYFLLSGERKLLYDAFYRIFSDPFRFEVLAQVLYLYIILKNKVRQEFIQTNPLVGFENFQIYQDRKDYFFLDPFWGDINISYAVFSGLGENSVNRLEGRVSPGALYGITTSHLRNPFAFENETISLRNREDVEGFSIVVHFIKKPVFKNTNSRYRQLTKFRKKLWEDTDLILVHTVGRRSYDRVRGIDVAGSELNCRPEIFAPMFRYAKANGLGNNMTYHAGEDFYDLVDGLRTIYEAIMFMNFDSGCRIGHGLALAKDASTYYADRHRIIIAPAQIVLDNLIWMKYYASENGIQLSEETLAYIERTSYDLGNIIGYKVVDWLEYWRSMLMRGNDNDIELTGRDESSFTKRHLTSRPDFLQNDRIYISSSTKELYREYELNDDIYRKGSEPYETKVPGSFASDVSRVQHSLSTLLKIKGITIESNPSSNLKIGGFKRYDSLPLFRLFPIEEDREKRMTVSINTDDRGVFYTSLRNEYSLIAAALMKMKDVTSGMPLYSITRVADYIDDLVQNGNNSIFPLINKRQ